jgi:DNA-binding transcriptional ArsR family regulator
VLKLFNVNRLFIIGELSIKESLHPNAYLSNVRNVSNGVKTRSKILETLESKPCDGVKIARETSLSYSVVMHHLRLLENEGIVHRKGRRPYYWMSTGLGQKRLVN